MNFINSSVFLKLLNKFDVTESSFILQSFKNSTFINVISRLLKFFQEKFEPLTKGSRLIKNIDYSIMFIISLILIAIPLTSTGIIGLLVVLGFLLILIKFLVVKGEGHSINSFDLPVFLYIIIAGLSVAFSSLFFPSLKGYFKMVVYFSGYLTFFNILKNHPKRIVYLLGLMALTVSLEAFYAIYQQVTGIEPLAAWQDESNANPEQLMDRVYGTLQPFNPNLLAGYLVAGFSSAVGTAFVFFNRKNVRIGAASLVGALAILLAIVFTGSRGAYVATAIMLGVFTIISGHLIWNEYSHIKWLKKLWIGTIIAGISLVILAVIASPALQHRIMSIFAMRDDSSNSFRMNVYASSIKMFLDNWLTGIGTGNTTFRLTYGLYMITGFDALGTYSVPLEVAVESGIFGFFAFVWILLLSFIKGVKFIYNNNNLENKIIVSSCIMAITGMMIHGFVDTIWYRPQINLIFWMIIAILASITATFVNGNNKIKSER